jgi:hypothetical protein
MGFRTIFLKVEIFRQVIHQEPAIAVGAGSFNCTWKLTVVILKKNFR